MELWLAWKSNFLFLVFHSDGNSIDDEVTYSNRKLLFNSEMRIYPNNYVHKWNTETKYVSLACWDREFDRNCVYPNWIELKEEKKYTSVSPGVEVWLAPYCTVGQISKESSCKYWATRLVARSFTCTAHLFAWSTLLAYLARSAAVTCSLAHFPHSFACGTVNEKMDILSVFYPVLDHSVLVG